jgi:hypothetical protein
MSVDEAQVEPTGVSRRDLLKRGAVVGAGVAWTVPVIQVVSMTPAHADVPSAPAHPNPPPPRGTPVQPPQPTPIPTTSTPTTSTPVHPSSSGPKSPSHRPATAGPVPGGSGNPPAAAGGPPEAPPTTLAFTGVDSPIAPTVGLGVGAVALGAGLLAVSRSRKPEQRGDAPVTTTPA